MYTQIMWVCFLCVCFFPFLYAKFKNSLTMSCIGDTNLHFENKFRSGLSSFISWVCVDNFQLTFCVLLLTKITLYDM